jgi:GT2 family glycosyltransferase
VIVVDNGSSDGSDIMVQNDFKQVKLIKNTQNKGFASANNQGMKIAAGRYILLLNSDTIVLGDVIAKTIQFADSGPQAAVVGCQILNSNRTLQHSCSMFPSIFNMLLSSTYLYKIFPRSKYLGRELMTWWEHDDFREVDVVMGCFMLVRRDAIEQVGLMDEQFFMYGEEVDWCWRFKFAGWKCILAPVGQIIHLGGQSTRINAGPMLLQLRGSKLLFFKKHKSNSEYLIACLLTALFFGVRLPWWAILSMLNPGQDNIRNRCTYYAKGFMHSLRGASYLCVKKPVGTIAEMKNIQN